MDLHSEYQKFIGWQCRLRKRSMRELDGRPTEGMTAGIYSVAGGDEQSRLNFLILHEDSADRTAEFRNIVRKSRDPSQWRKNGLTIWPSGITRPTRDFAIVLLHCSRLIRRWQPRCSRPDSAV